MRLLEIFFLFEQRRFFIFDLDSCISVYVQFKIHPELIYGRQGRFLVFLMMVVLMMRQGLLLILVFIIEFFFLRETVDAHILNMEGGLVGDIGRL